MTRDIFNDYVRQLSRKLYGFAFRILRNQEEAEDAVQEVFIKLWNMGDKLNDYRSIEALATTMTKNYCIDQVRKQKNIFFDQTASHEYIPSASASPLELMERKEDDSIIGNIINDMPDIYKLVIHLRDIEGFTFEEISEKTDQNINTVRVTLSRARSIVREAYKKHFDENRGIKQTAR